MIITIGIIMAIFFSIIATSHALALATMHLQASNAASRALDSAQAALLRYERIRLASSLSTPDTPTIASACSATPQLTCAFELAVTIVVLPTLTGNVHNEQANGQVREERQSYQLVARASTRNGTLLATHERLIAVRLLRSEPFAMISASHDTTVRSVGSGTGDDGGLAPTTVHVQYVNAASGASFSGDIFTQATAPPAAPTWSN